MDTSTAGSTILRLTSRLTLASFILTLPGFDFYCAWAAVARNSPVRAGRRLTPVPILKTPRASAGAPPVVRAPSGRAATPAALRALSAADDLSRSLNSPRAADSGLRAAAGRPFEGSATRRAESPAVFAAPGSGFRALAAGPDPGGGTGGVGPGGGSGPSKNPVDRAEETLGALSPGEIVNADVEKVLVDELQIMDRAELAKILSALADRGRLARLPNGLYLYTDLADRVQAKEENPSLKRANALAFKAVKLLNSGSGADLVKALAHLARAADAYETLQNDEKKAVEGIAHVFALRNNAALAMLGGILRGYKAELSTRDQGDADVLQLTERVDEALVWTSRSFYSSDHAPARPDAGLIQFLASVAASEAPPRAKKQTAAHVAYRSLRHFIDGLADSSSKHPVLGSPPVRSFSLIGAEDPRYATLNSLGINVTGLALMGKLDPMIGRKKELRQLRKILGRRKKNNAVLVGEAGVGKSAIIGGLAQDIVDGKIPEMADKNIFQINVTDILASDAKHETKYVGQIETKMKALLDEVRASKGRVILAIDEIHRIMGAGTSEKDDNDLANMLKELMAGGEIMIIGATTPAPEEWGKLEKDEAISRRVEKIDVPEPSQEEAAAIIMGVKHLYEKHHGVTFGKETVEEAVANAARYITDRHLPDSALTLIDDASVEVKLQAAEGRVSLEVTPQDVAFEISLRKGIPVGKVSADDRDLIRGLPKALSSRVVGQPEAVKKFARVYRRSRYGYRDPNKPRVFVLVGPTGSGKTHLVRTVAVEVYGSEESLVRLDMSEFKGEGAVNSLIGPPPGYEGHGKQRGRLTEPVRQRPYSPVLLDEIDKADPAVFDLLLQIMDTGIIHDSEGHPVNFRNTDIFLTANTGGSLADGSDRGGKPISGFKPGAHEDAARLAKERGNRYVEEFEKSVRAELFGRVRRSNVIAFNALTRQDLEQILEILIGSLGERLRKEKKMDIKLTPDAKKRLIEIATTPEKIKYGARPLEEALEEEVEDALSEAEEAGAIADGDSVLVDYKDGAWVVARK